jgi:hypothetical protein
MEMEAAGSFLQIRVSYRGKAYNLRNAGSDTLAALAKQLEDLTGASSETIKFILPKGKRSSAGKATPSALQPLSPQWRSSTLLEAGFFQVSCCDSNSILQLHATQSRCNKRAASFKIHLLFAPPFLQILLRSILRFCK